jgi:hypothetical protein
MYLRWWGILKFRLGTLLYAILVLAVSVLPLFFSGAFPAEMLEKVQIQDSDLMSFLERLAIIGVIYSALLFSKGLTDGRKHQAASIAASIYLVLILILGLFSPVGEIGQIKVTSTLGGAENTFILKTGFFSIIIILSLLVSTLYSIYKYRTGEDPIKNDKLEKAQIIL